MNCQLYSGWCLGKRKPGIVSDGEGLVEAMGDSTEVGDVGFSWGVWIGACEGDSAWVVDLCDEKFREEGVGVGEGGCCFVREGGGYPWCMGVGSGFRSAGEETSGGQGEGRQGFYLVVPISRHLCGQGLLPSLLSFS